MERIRMLCVGAGAGKTLGDRQATGTFRTTCYGSPKVRKFLRVIWSVGDDSAEGHCELAPGYCSRGWGLGGRRRFSAGWGFCRLHRLGVPKDERLNEPTLSPRDSS